MAPTVDFVAGFRERVDKSSTVAFGGMSQVHAIAAVAYAVMYLAETLRARDAQQASTSIPTR